MKLDLTSITLKAMLYNVLPSIVWIGFTKQLTQPAKLVDKDTHYDYEVQNTVLREMPIESQYFKTIKECEYWIEKIIERVKIIDNRSEYLKSLLELENWINQYFNYMFFKDKLITSNNYNITDRNTIHILTQIKLDLDLEISIHEQYLNEWCNKNNIPVQTNKIGFDEMICKIENFIQIEYPQYKEILYELFNNCSINIKEISYIELSELASVPLIASIKYKDSKTSEIIKKQKIMREKQHMRNVWLNKF